MITSTTAPASGAPTATSRASLPLSTQQQPAHGRAPTMCIRLPQASFPVAPATGTPAVADNAPHLINHSASNSPRSRLFAAVRNGDGNAVKSLIRAGQCDLDIIDPATGMNVLLVAARHGHDDIVHLLCKGATRSDLHRTDAQGNSALMLAAGAGHADLVTLRVERGADVDLEDNSGNTALMQLAARGQIGLARLLINAGADPAHRNHVGQTAAQLAMAEGHYFVAAALSGIAPNAPADTIPNSVIGSTATTSAAPQAFLPSSPATGSKGTAPASLAEAIAADDAAALERVLATLRQSGQDVPQLLARAGKLKTSDPCFEDQHGTSLMAAAHLGHASLIPVLLAAGAEVDCAMADDWTALLFAAQQGHAAAVQALIAGGADVDQADAEGETALIFAARHGHTAVVKLLLQAGAAMDHENVDGDTALMEATWKGDARTVRALLKAKANPSH